MQLIAALAVVGDDDEGVWVDCQVVDDTAAAVVAVVVVAMVHYHASAIVAADYRLVAVVVVVGGGAVAVDHLMWVVDHQPALLSVWPLPFHAELLLPLLLLLPVLVLLLMLPQQKAHLIPAMAEYARILLHLL